MRNLMKGALYGLAAGAALVAAIAASPAQAQSNCGMYTKIKAAAAGKYGEKRAFMAKAGRAVLELWHNPDTGTFTIMTITELRRAGQAPILWACVRATGKGKMLAVPKGEGA